MPPKSLSRNLGCVIAVAEQAGRPLGLGILETVLNQISSFLLFKQLLLLLSLG